MLLTVVPEALGALVLVVRLSVHEAYCVEQLQELRVGAAGGVLAMISVRHQFAVVGGLDPEAVLRLAPMRRVKL